MRKRIGCLLLALLLLPGCGPGGEAPAPAPEPTAAAAPGPEALTWLHGFYAVSSYSQFAMIDRLDAVSLGWGRLFVDEEGTPYVNSAPTGGNYWVRPEGAEEVLAALAEKGKVYNLCVFASAGHPYGDTNVLAYAISPERRGETAAMLAREAEGYTGLTVDFEGLGASGREDFSAFMGELRAALGPDKLLYAAVPPDLWYRGYDYRAIGAVCDKVILMAHDYQWTRVDPEKVGTADTDTPVAPIGHVAYALARITDPETGVEDLSKVALALSFASCGVTVEEEGDILAGESLVGPGPGTLSQRLAQEDAEPGWSDLYQSPYVFYHDEGGTRYKVWYEDARSVRAKIKEALGYGVTGLSLWRLGTVPDYDNYDVWSAILEEAER